MASDLERVYDEHAQALFAFSLNLLRNESDARDVLQEVFAKLASHPHTLDHVRDARGFLFRMAHNAAINLMRRQQARDSRHHEFASEPVFEPACDPDLQAFRDTVAAAMAELPADQRAVLHLKVWEGLTFDAIAKTLEISPNTAASRYRYALDKIRDRLRPILDDFK